MWASFSISIIQGEAEETYVFRSANTRQGKGWGFPLLLVDSLDCAVSVAMAPWTLEH
jgi:hypothetical protein